ncbi:hypothetical protein BHYA_0161g00240 [Botrytis hyacinthi]|uniref:Uncharacterized protein n=1 Tax=Botrytis hyacinthi TaxID=278943 RepID=A0A4Z1GIW4_9HELO|nr:hypothetical protein BHYA_0161g00240 [Botrytis hyacinthi]
MSFNRRSSSSHKEPQADGSQVKDTNLDQASSGPSVMMGEESKDKNPPEGKPAKKKRERKHRQGFYNRDRRMHGVQRTFGFWEPAGREGAEQDAAKTKDILTSSCISWLQKHHCALVAREGWGNGKKGSLELYHEMFESSAEIKDKTLQLVAGETAEIFLTLLEKVRQIRHCVFRRSCCIDIPIIIVELMLEDAIRLTRMVGGRKSLPILEKLRNRLTREIALNGDIEAASDRLRSLFKQEGLDLKDEIQVRAIRAQRVELGLAIEQKKRQLKVIDNQFVDEVKSGR